MTGDALTQRIIGGRFRLEALLGAGGHADVWRAHDSRDGRAVAIKVLRTGRRNKGSKKRFRREADILRKLNHPNIAAALAFGEDEERPFLVLELVEGKTLNQMIIERARSKEHFTARELLALLDAICTGVAYAHEADVLHRDLKPTNIIVTNLKDDACALKILDFGVAKLVGAEIDRSEETTRGRLVGSILHMSPEQAKGEEVDLRTDVFAIGVMIFELVTLRTLWTRDEEGFPPLFGMNGPRELNDIPRVLGRILREPRPRAGFFRTGCPEALDLAIDRALSIARAARTESVQILMTEVRAALALFEEPANRTLIVDVRDPTRTDLIAPTSVEPRAAPSFTMAWPQDTLIRSPRPKRKGFGLGMRIGSLAAIGALAFLASVASRGHSPARDVPSAPTEASPSPPVPAVVAQPQGAPPLAADEPETETAIEPATPVALAAPRHARPQKVVKVDQDPRSAELTRLAKELHDAPNDATIARIARRVAELSRTLPSTKASASIVRRAAAAGLYFDAAALERCISDLTDELRVLKG